MSNTSDSAIFDLDAVERLLLQAVEGKPSPMVLANALKALDYSAPRAELTELGRSGCELMLLARVLGVDISIANPAAPERRENVRGGYQLFADGHTTKVYPLLAAMLAQPAPCSGPALEPFTDLWRIDWQVASLLYSGRPARVVAESWFRSPGRRLLRDLGLLRCPLGLGPGATDWSWSRILQAAGMSGNATATNGSMHRFQPGWHQLHDAIPGAALRTWQPEHDAPIIALHLLECTIPLFVRAAALLWLLNRAMDNPLFTMAGEDHDLRDELRVPLITSLSPDLAGASLTATRLAGLSLRQNVSLRWQYEYGHILETSALLLAAQLAAQPPDSNEEPNVVSRRPSTIWGVARWLLDCMLHSPFLGMNEAQLALTVRAQITRPLVPPNVDNDFLHPSRFRDNGTGLDVAEIAVLDAVHAHYARARRGQPVCPPNSVIQNLLQEVASRALNEGELLAEKRLAECQEALLRDGGTKSISMSEFAESGPPCGDMEWTAPHVAPPLLARYLLSTRKEPWIGALSETARKELFLLLASEPARYLPWLTFALILELPSLSATIRADILAVWRQLTRTHELGESHLPDDHGFLLAMLGAGLLDELHSVNEQDMLICLAKSAPSEWMPAVLDQLARAAMRTKKIDVWRRALSLLRTVTQDISVPKAARLSAALALVQRAASEETAWNDNERAEQLDWIRVHLNRPPFSGHLGLRRALRTFGILLS